MNLDQLRGFVAIARTGHFTRAAEQLHLAQPSLSRQISTLEQELGAEVFHRARGNIALTAAGEALLPRARRMLAEADAVREDMSELRGLRSGRVRLGAPPTLCLSIVAEAVTDFHAAHPGVELQLVEGGSRLLLDQLAVGAIDFALITASDEAPAPGVSLTRTPLLAEELVVVASAHGHLLPHREGAPPAEIDLETLSTLPLVAFAESYSLRATADAAFRAAGLTPSPIIEGAEMDTVLRFVERGLGVALVPAMVLHDRPGLRSARLIAPRLERTVSLAHRTDVTPPRAAEAMRQAIIATAAGLVERDPATRLLLERR
ncbi:LysR substrate-binding domain-containing protein [Microbacterium pseudoresistens]|uniref:DNA-binding transcriptional LysR family regulator n=1 Tax=Microbacterium pseudoresistens TaxID=640634 RepID=A0A7Y9ETF7_9MICO|nr:LysR family transcriptional regulator [Microbacterium pseudoresistens]NYD53598.1 DNA-binding transcriptional LysR family regulator [Microbacterium pseudoresistens]